VKIEPLKTKKISKILKLLIPAILVFGALFGTIEVAVQQNYRQSGNDPQIQMAQDQAKSFEGGQKIETVNSLAKIDLSLSLAPFLIVYNSQGNPVASSAILNGRIPVPPAGVFEAANNQGEDRITWQPSGNVRIAAVVVPFHGQNSGYVLAGRSLREVEKREDMLVKQVAAGFISTLTIIFILGLIFA
jgi:hypothetical protein